MDFDSPAKFISLGRPNEFRQTVVEGNENYKGGGASSYHPKIMLKVLVYAYIDMVYTSRRIAKALRENVNTMWLAGNNQPGFRTVGKEGDE